MGLLSLIENNELLINITNSNFLTFALLFLALAALFIPFLLKEKKKFVYSIRSYSLIENLDDFKDLKILYKDKEINNLIISKVAFWNNGRSTIRKEDIAEADPIRISMDGDSKIYHARIIKKDKANNLIINWPENKENNFINIFFDYLNKNDGGVIEVLHTGDTLRKLKVTGSLKGCKKLINNKYIYVSPSEQSPLISISFERKLFGLTLLAMAIMFTFFYFNAFKSASFDYHNYFTQEDINIEMKLININIHLLFFCSICTPLLYYFAYILLIKSRAPSGFKEFEKK